jgi:hypothetical protein
MLRRARRRYSRAGLSEDTKFGAPRCEFAIRQSSGLIDIVDMRIMSRQPELTCDDSQIDSLIRLEKNDISMYHLDR